MGYETPTMRSKCPSMPRTFPLLSFPNELLLMVASNLTLKDIASMVLTGRYLHTLLTTELYNIGAKHLALNGSPLHWAAEFNQLGTARRLISCGADLSLQRPLDRQTPLHLAAACGHLELIKFMYDPSLATMHDGLGKTPFHVACAMGQEEIVRHILSRMPSALTLQTPIAQRTPLHCAAENGRGIIVRLLISLGAYAEIPDAHDITPLHLAAREGHYDVCKFLIDCGARVTLAGSPDGNSPLHGAAARGYHRVVELLVASGAVPSQRNINGETPIHRAIRNAREPVVKFLLEHDTTGRLIQTLCTAGQSLLTYAFDGKPPSVSLLSILLDHGADVNFRTPSNGQTPLFRAAAAKAPGALALFLSHGADVNATDLFKATALHEAASLGRIPAIELLIKHSASIDAEDYENQTPLYYAVEHGREDVVRKFLELGADINARDRLGMSPLSRACAQCPVHINVNMVRLLIEEGADVRSADDEGMTALHHASREGHEEVVKLLLKGGARAKDRDECGDNALDVAWAFRKPKIVELLRMNMGMIAC